MKIHIETERLIMREFTEGDASDLFELDSDPEVHRFLGNNPIKHIDTCREVIRTVQGQYENHGIGRWAVVLKESNEMVGWSGLKYETSLKEKGPYYDMGYRLKRKHWGKGIATETALESLKYGFETMNLNLINAGAHINNNASNHIIKKIGFQFVEEIMWEDDPCNWYELFKTNWQSL